jgi:hypothetical protein
MFSGVEVYLDLDRINISDLCVHPKQQRILAAHGIHTLGDAVDFGLSKLISIRGIGGVTYFEIRLRLKVIQKNSEQRLASLEANDKSA